MIIESLKSIARDPTIGGQTSDGKVRIKIVGHYLIVYNFKEAEVNVLSI